MSYMNELVDALVKVVTTAAGASPAQFAGYVANRHFWVDEAAHVLAVLARCIKVHPDTLDAVMDECRRLGIATPI